MTTPLRPVALDHIVLIVDDVDRSLGWYLGVVGLAPVRVDEWRKGEAPFPSVRVSGDTIIDIIARRAPVTVEPNLDHLCLTVECDDLQAWASAHELTVLDAGDRFGARGVATSIYVHDPDGNTVELRTYPA
jgi:catechol 2,3-dioxygenase-like lactoylglutathione lyase family enzyme